MQKLEYNETIELITKHLSGVMGRDLTTDLIYTRWTEVTSRQTSQEKSLIVTYEQAYTFTYQQPAVGSVCDAGY